MSTLDCLAKLDDLSDDDKLELLILIESREYYKAISMIRISQEPLFAPAKIIQKIAKEELNLDIMPYLK